MVIDNKALKELILKNNVGEDPLIFKYSDTPFLSMTYVDGIAKAKGKRSYLLILYLRSILTKISLNRNQGIFISIKWKS